MRDSNKIRYWEDNLRDFVGSHWLSLKKIQKSDALYVRLFSTRNATGLVWPCAE